MIYPCDGRGLAARPGAQGGAAGAGGRDRRAAGSCADAVDRPWRACWCWRATRRGLRPSRRRCRRCRAAFRCGWPTTRRFHTALQAPVAAEGRALLADGAVRPAEAAADRRARRDLVAGRHRSGAPCATIPWGIRWWSPMISPRAIRIAAREFAPDLFIVTGPGTTLGGAVAQSLILADWRGHARRRPISRHDRPATPLLVSMGMDDQRGQRDRQEGTDDDPCRHPGRRRALTAAELTGGTLAVRSPIDGAELARMHETDPDEMPAIIARAQAAFRPVARGAGPAARRAGAAAGRGTARRQGRTGRAGDAGGRQDHLGRPGRSAGDDRHLRFRRGPVAADLRADHRLGTPRPPDDGNLAPDGAVRRDLGLQLPGRGLVVERGAGAGLRRSGDLEAVGEDAADRAWPR